MPLAKCDFFVLETGMLLAEALDAIERGSVVYIGSHGQGPTVRGNIATHEVISNVRVADMFYEVNGAVEEMFPSWCTMFQITNASCTVIY